MASRHRAAVVLLLVGLALGVLLERGFHPGGVLRPAPPPAPELAEGWRVVERVVDGDTLVLDGGERVRLIGVDTPELHHPEVEVESFAEESAAFTERMCLGKRVRLEYDHDIMDHYGRTLAYVYLEDGKLLNAEIIRQGYGHAYTRFPFAHRDEFRVLEREARAARRGLWAQD
jgi:micrococcal nuclease